MVNSPQTIGNTNNIAQNNSTLSNVEKETIASSFEGVLNVMVENGLSIGGIKQDYKVG